MIIKHPMDFSTMKEKIKNNDYQSIEELKVTRAVCVVIGQIIAMTQSNFSLFAWESSSWILYIYIYKILVETFISGI